MGAIAASTILAALPALAASETVVYSFKGGSDGAFPYCSLTNENGTLYGTTWAGGASGGTVFSVTLRGKETILQPLAALATGNEPRLT
jgi:uncharacterized repeat protein (TIGR03803 family)